jgi:hypothetical protein
MLCITCFVRTFLLLCGADIFQSTQRSLKASTKAVFVDRRRCDADPDPDLTYHFDADLDPVSDWQQNNADPHADSSPSYCIRLLKNRALLYYFNSQQCQFTMFFFCH